MTIGRQPIGVTTERASSSAFTKRPSLLTSNETETTGSSNWGFFHPITLYFYNKEDEKQFREHYHLESKNQIQFAIAFGLFLIVIFGALDAILQPTVVRQLWFIRYGFIFPTVSVALITSLIPRFSRYVEWPLVAGLLANGWGVIWMILISPEPARHLYYAGLILTIMFGCIFLKMRLVLASSVAFILLLSYVLAELFIGRAPAAYFTNNMFYFVAATIIGVFTTYFLESLARRNFIQELQMKRARAFGSYRLVNLLGSGGMGEVWHAAHAMLARPAAIKLIKPSAWAGSDTKDAILKRFEREAQTTAFLRSPHTVTLYDFGVTEDGSFYYVMELLDGYDLNNLVVQFGPLPSGRVVHLIRQICESLAEAHSRGLVHRDIKPANVFTCKYGRACDFVKVLDFGLVKTPFRPLNFDKDLTQSDVAGTPLSMAPEQIAGRTMDGRSDLYGVGCVAFWLLTGRHVFEADTAVELVARHLEAEPPAPSSLAHQPVSPGLDEIVLACLSKNPSDRPSSAEALNEMLAVCDGTSEWSNSDSARWWEEHPNRASYTDHSDIGRSITPSFISQTI